MSAIEFIEGKEQHSSNWGKFYIKGFSDEQRCKEDYSNFDKHHSYQEWTATAPEGTVFTIFEQNGDKRGTDEFFFSVCVTTDEQVSSDDASYGEGKIAGNYRVIVCGEGKTRGPRMMDWWTKHGDKSLAWAEHCAQYINKRGCKMPPAMEQPAATAAPSELNNAIADLVSKHGYEAVAASLKLMKDL